MRRRLTDTLVAISLLANPLLLVAADQADALAAIDSTVATANERELLINQVRDSLRLRLQHANDASTAGWKAVQTRADWEQFRDGKLSALRASLGHWPNPVPAVRTETTAEIPGEGFRIRNILFETRPGWWVSANLYVPDPLVESMPGIVICHAHHTSKTHGELQDMGMTWARAGCYVLVPDQVGHGERRQHPFESAADYSKPFGVSRQDYYFRYDNAIQLHLAGESLVGWMAWDMMRGADVLLKLTGIDSKRLLLLGGVAGGGDPAAVTGALDDRFAAVVPFNFGGPQPETRFPLPDDIETSFNYAGSGGWESTRNLYASADGGFLPWVIVGGIAPRKLIYAHEFRWDRDRDPVWMRLEKIYALYEQPGNLSYTHGHGELKGQPPEASHCTHIGAPHRVRIHAAFATWFGIKVTPETEYSDRIPAERLRCWTPELKERLQPRSLTQVATELVEAQKGALQQSQAGQSPEQRRKELQARWHRILGEIDSERLTSAQQQSKPQIAGAARVEHWLLTAESGIRIPCVVIRPEKSDRSKPVILAICSQGKGRLLKERAAEMATLVEAGATICLIDPRGIGESKLGDSHTRRSSATSHSSTGLMLERPLLGEQLRDVRLALHWIRQRSDVGFRPLVIWGESLVAANAADAPFRTPRDDDQALPAVSEPQAPLLAVLAGLYEDDLDAIYSVGGLVSFRSLLQSYLVLTAHDVIVPGAIRAGDLDDILAVLPAATRIHVDTPVDGWNRNVAGEALKPLTAISPQATFQATRQGLATWVFEGH
jgi:cephalosporin-C deacetylase-like acetyl esterase